MDKNAARVEITLKHDCDLRMRPRNRFSVEAYRSAGDRNEAGEHKKQRTLAATARPDNGDEPTRIDGKIEPVKRPHFVAGLRLIDFGDIVERYRNGMQPRAAGLICAVWLIVRAQHQFCC